MVSFSKTVREFSELVVQSIIDIEKRLEALERKGEKDGSSTEEN